MAKTSVQSILAKIPKRTPQSEPTRLPRVGSPPASSAPKNPYK
jgi:hypothetical protein